MSAVFPLILTFSLGEKEQPLHISTFAKTSRAADRSLTVHNSPGRYKRHIIIRFIFEIT
ncbi:MAG TPA: hypothetical protein VK742_17830 [Candidatus Sulfotelmatobacter sp.]|jgi:hypothetical protein|nr:hypothetical protein [Candidatus Sulfotelmatobacter sp.]